MWVQTPLGSRSWDLCLAGSPEKEATKPCLAASDVSSFSPLKNELRSAEAVKLSAPQQPILKPRGWEKSRLGELGQTHFVDWRSPSLTRDRAEASVEVLKKWRTAVAEQPQPVAECLMKCLQIAVEASPTWQDFAKNPSADSEMALTLGNLLKMVRKASWDEPSSLEEWNAFASRARILLSNFQHFDYGDSSSSLALIPGSWVVLQELDRVVSDWVQAFDERLPDSEESQKRAFAECQAFAKRFEANLVDALVQAYLAFA